jgi:HAD superfamily hydrolase (TIGR01549 family)
MADVKAIVFDFIGTLCELVSYSLEEAEDKMFTSLVRNGYNLEHESFFKAYDEAHQKYREIRYEQLVEVANTVWISEALNSLGHTTSPEDEGIKTAVTAFFEDYLTALKLRPSARSTLKKLCQEYKLGLISNYTHSPLIYAALRKLQIDKFFDVVVVSEAVGWRKPSPRIFQEVLRRLRLRADEVVFVGDTPLEDILGARRMGMHTVFIPSQFKGLADLENASLQPDYVIENLSDVPEILNRLTARC